MGSPTRPAVEPIRQHQGPASPRPRARARDAIAQARGPARATGAERPGTKLGLAAGVARISFDPDPVAEHLVDRDGEPVWPLRCAEDHDALSALASVFGAELSAVRGRPGASRAGWEEVVAVGAEHEADARLHAHLTGRRFRGVRSAAALAVEATPAVVVTSLDLLGPRLTDALHRGGGGPGFVVAGQGPLRRQVLRRAAAARLVSPAPFRRADVLPFAGPAARPHPVAARGDAGDRVRALLGAGAGVLTVLTHSDGVDASLGDLVLCPMGEPVAGADPARSPSCWSSGICHRLARPIDEALTSGRIARADEIRCRVLLWNACFTLAYQDDPLDPRWSVLARLLDAPGIGALAIAPDLSHDSTSSLEPLAAAIARGARLGDALAEHNRDPGRRAIGARLILFGDPRVALMPPARGSTAELEPERAAPPPLPASSSGWPMLETLAAADLDSPSFFAGPARAALAAVERAAPDQEIRERFAELLACRVRAFTQWTSLSDPERVRGRPTACPRCAGPARQVGYTMRAPRLAPRVVTICPRCQVVEDVPAGCDLTVAIAGDDIAIGGTLPGRDWAARARLYAQVPWNGPLVRWPAAPDGSPVRRLEVGPVAASGVHQVTFVLVSGREYAAVTAREPIAAALALEKAS